MIGILQLGGGVFANLAQMMTLNLSAFNSDDGLRLAFRMGFGFLMAKNKKPLAGIMGFCRGHF